MSPITTTTTNTSVSRSSVWRSFSLHIAGRVGGKTRVTISERKHGSSFASTPAPSIALPAGPHRRMSAASLRPALRRASTDSATSCSSSESSSPSPAVKITFPIFSPEVDRKILLPENTKFNSARPSIVQPTEDSACLWLLRRPRTSSTRQRPTSQVFPDLTSTPELDEVSLTIESDDDDSEDGDAEVLLGMERKVRFLVPASPPPIEEDYYEEPVWSEFMGAKARMSSPYSSPVEVSIKPCPRGKFRRGDPNKAVISRPAQARKRILRRKFTSYTVELLLLDLWRIPRCDCWIVAADSIISSTPSPTSRSIQLTKCPGSIFGNFTVNSIRVSFTYTCRPVRAHHSRRRRTLLKSDLRKDKLTYSYAILLTAMQAPNYVLEYLYTAVSPKSPCDGIEICSALGAVKTLSDAEDRSSRKGASPFSDSAPAARCSHSSSQPDCSRGFR
ncbi:hypothetical protein C8R44DRAFT_748724 [Mycena epipterygia]|nr:hypothetical protein C8R44DRAFT_748724 [Mycena epipterygia]